MISIANFSCTVNLLCAGSIEKLTFLKKSELLDQLDSILRCQRNGKSTDTLAQRLIKDREAVKLMYDQVFQYSNIFYEETVVQLLR